jgi:hypothetical protein
MLVMQPRMSTPTDCTAVDVNVGDGVSVGGMSVFVAVGEGASVLVIVTGTMTVTPGTAVVVKGRVIMIGVGVMTPGVREGITVHTGNG